MSAPRRPGIALLAAVLAAGLAACGSEEHSDLKEELYQLTKTCAAASTRCRR